MAERIGILMSAEIISDERFHQVNQYIYNVLEKFGGLPKRVVKVLFPALSVLKLERTDLNIDLQVSH